MVFVSFMLPFLIIFLFALILGLVLKATKNQFDRRRPFIEFDGFFFLAFFFPICFGLAVYFRTVI